MDRNTVGTIIVILCLVAPRRGAWIEIRTSRQTCGRWFRRSPQGSVDRNENAPLRRLTAERSLPAGERGSKYSTSASTTSFIQSLPAGERGSKYSNRLRTVSYAGRSPQGSVDRNVFARVEMLIVDMVAPRRGAWIEIVARRPSARSARVAPRRGAWIEIF